MNIQKKLTGEFRQIQKSLISNDPAFLDLDLCVRSGNVDEVCVIMGDVAFNKYLKILRVSFYNHKDEQINKSVKLKTCTALSLALEKNYTIRDVYISLGSIDLSCLKILLNGLRQSRIKLVNLSSSAIGDEGILQLVDALIPNKYLRKLYLFCCNIGPIGEVALMELMKKKKILKIRWDQQQAPSSNPIWKENEFVNLCPTKGGFY